MNRKAIIHSSKPLRSRRNKGSLAWALSPPFSLDSKRAKGARRPRRSCCCLAVRAEERALSAPFPSPPDRLERGKRVGCAVNVAVAPRERREHAVRAVPIAAASPDQSEQGKRVGCAVHIATPPRKRGERIAQMAPSPTCCRSRWRWSEGAQSHLPPPVPVFLSAAAMSMGDRSPLPAPSALPRLQRRRTGRDVTPRPSSPQPSRQRTVQRATPPRPRPGVGCPSGTRLR